MQFEEHIDSEIHNSFSSGAPFNKAEGAKGKWMNTGWWAKFIAIFIAVFLVIGFVALIFVGFNVGELIHRDNSILLVIGCMVLMAAMTYWTRELWLFGNDVRAGIKSNNMNRFNRGLGHLKTYFIIFTISLVLSLFWQLYSYTFNPMTNNKELQEIIESQE